VALLINILNALTGLVCVFLICLILIQRGKGGGLAGAFGGMGGSSAFGTKAGDVFTRVTIIVAAIWFSLTLILNILSNQRATSAWGDEPSRTVTKQLPNAPAPVGPAKGSTSPLTKPTAIPTHDTPAAPVSVPAIPSEPLRSPAPAGKTP